MAIPPRIADIWNAFSKSVGGVDEARLYEAFHFADTEPVANELADLVLAGTKRATAGAVWLYEAEGKRLPAPGDLSVVTDWPGVPKCIIETIAVDVVPFNQVTAEFAATEGEGDGSLEYWREAHRQFFSRECASHGRRFTEDMPVACERFKVVFRPRQGVRLNPSLERTSAGMACLTQRQRGLFWRWGFLALGIAVFIILQSRVSPALMKLYLLVAMGFAVAFDKPVRALETPGEALESFADRHPLIRVFFLLMAIAALAAFWISTHSSVRWLDIVGDEGATVFMLLLMSPLVLVSEYRRFVEFGKGDAI